MVKMETKKGNYMLKYNIIQRILSKQNTEKGHGSRA